MPSIVNAAITALVAALNANPPVCSHIGRVRLRAIPKSAPTYVVARPDDGEADAAQVTNAAPVSWSSRIAVDCYARVAAGSNLSPDQAVDPLATAVMARIADDPTLGGAVLSMRPASYAYDFDADGEQTVCLTFVFIARQRAGSAFFSA